MIRSMKKIFIVAVLLTLAFGIIGLNYSNAGEGSISVSSAKVGQEFTVTVTIPSDAVGYNGKISVTFGNGETVNSGVLAKVTGLDGDFTHPGNMTFTCKAPVAGNAMVKVTDLTLSGRSSEKLNTQSTLEKTFTVASSDPTPPAPTTPAKPSIDPGHTATGDTVYALEKLNVRKGNSASTEKLGSLDKNAKTKRISVGPDGWDKIEFNGSTGYVVSKYLTTQSPEERAKLEPKWTEKEETVYALHKVNVRKGWGTNYDVIGGLTPGKEATRVAKGDNGWDKIKYENGTGYVMSKYLTTDKEKAEELLAEAEKEENEVENNTVADNTITANNTVENTMTNEEIYNTIVDEIGVIPQVGNSTGGYMYYISIVIAVIMVATVGLKIRSKEKEE